jgi:peroxiredoxin Q/BCP
MAELNTGDQAPTFSLLDQEGKTVKLADFKGRKLLLYFYPRASTPGCTEQACSIRDAWPDLTPLGLDAVGISPDRPEDQKKFAENYDLPFPLLSDPDHSVAEAYGVWGEKSMYGKKSMGIIRSSFLIDEKGKIIALWYKVSPKDTVPKAIAALSDGS